MKPFGSYHEGGIDTVSLANGNLEVHADLFDWPQRGGELSYPIVLQYNSKDFKLFYVPCPNVPHYNCPVHLHFGPPTANVDKDLGNSVSIGFAGYSGEGGARINTGLTFNGNPIYVNTSIVMDPDGATHPLVTSDSGLVALDGSGFAQPNGQGDLEARNGTFSAPLGTGAIDRNGNQLDTTEDTLGRPFPANPGPAPAATPAPSTAQLGSCPVVSGQPPVTSAYLWTLPAPASASSPLTLTLCYATVYVRPAFFSGGAGPLMGPFNMLQSVLLPDQSYWDFEYDAADPNNSASVGYGDLLKIRFPTGGTVSYTYSTMAPCNSYFTPGANSTSRAVLTRTVDANDGTGPHTWHYFFDNETGTSAGLTHTNVVTDPEGNDTVHTFTGLGATCSLYETQTQFFQGSRSTGALLKTVKTDYQYTANPWDTNLIEGGSTADSVANVVATRVTTILPNGLTSKVERDYDSAVTYHGPLDGISSNQQTCTTDPVTQIQSCSYGATTTEPAHNYTGSYGRPVAVREYDWGQGAPGPLLRQTATTYQWQVNSAYLTANLMDLPATVRISDGAGHLCAETDYFYDETTPAIGNGTQHTTPLAAVRGNLTTVKRKLSPTPCAASPT